MTEPPHVYDDFFFEHLDRSSRSSAGEFVSRLDLGFPVRSLLDVGCGLGAWLAAWRARGVPDVLGVDGACVDEQALLVPPSAFVRRDVGHPFDLGRTFDLVQCLEVAEHLREDQSETLLGNLTRHGDCILFSAATPGQGGEHHVNERPLEDWVERFHALGYRCFDAVRPQLRAARRVEPWYRYNTLLFVGARHPFTLQADLLSTECHPGQPLRAFASPSWRARQAILRALPRGLVNSLARLRHRIRAPWPGPRRPAGAGPAQETLVPTRRQRT